MLKKVLILIFIVSLFTCFCSFAYAAEIPNNLINHFNELNYDYKVITLEGDYYWLIYTNSELTVKNSQLVDFDGTNYNLYNYQRFTLDGNEYGVVKNVGYTILSDVNHTVLLSNFDIKYYNSSDVFFSLPKFLPSQEVPSIVPTVVQQSKVILVVSVVILALMMVVTLIPRVLYRL